MGCAELGDGNKSDSMRMPQARTGVPVCPSKSLPESVAVRGFWLYEFRGNVRDARKQTSRTSERHGERWLCH